MPDNHNPHSSAASTYGNNAQKHTSDPREVEARVLLKSASMMQDLQTNWNPDDHIKIGDVLKYNRQIWMLFFDTALENKDGNRPDSLRSNIINLANFVFKRTVEILADPRAEKFNVLISINRDIAAGLMTNAETKKTTNPGKTATTA